MGRALINVPKTARKGEIVEIRALISHPMETGYRAGSDGRTLPRDIIRRFTCRYNSEGVFSADLYPAISANPYLAFNVVANAINVYFTPNIANEDGSLCGRGSFTTSTPQGVAMPLETPMPVRRSTMPLQSRSRPDAPGR